MTFLPYIGEHFAKQYIVPLYIGESVSSSIPSLIVFFQGSTNPDEGACTINQQLSATTEENLVAPKRQYFVHQKHNLTAIKTAENVLPQTLKTHPNFSVSIFFLIIAGLMLFSSLAFFYIDVKYAKKKLMKEELLTKIDEKRKEAKERQAFLKQDIKNQKLENDIEAKIESPNRRHLVEKITLFVISFFISCFMYGILPGI